MSLPPIFTVIFIALIKLLFNLALIIITVHAVSVFLNQSISTYSYTQPIHLGSFFLLPEKNPLKFLIGKYLFLLKCLMLVCVKIVFFFTLILKR